MAKENRVRWIDVARGIGILFVILGHTMTTPIRYASSITYWIYTAIYFFHMPFMFYLSGRTFGMFYQRNRKFTPKEWTKKKWNTLMIPYLTYGTLVYLIFFVANQIPAFNRILEPEGYGKQSVLHWLKGMVTVYGDDLYAIHLWFIYALFLMNLVSYLVVRYCRYSRQVLGVLVILLGLLRVQFIEINNWGILNLFMKCYMWFVLGTYVDLSVWAKRWFGKAGALLATCYLCLYTSIVTENSRYVPQMLVAGIKHLSPVWLECVKWIADIGLIMGLLYLAMVLRGSLNRFFSYTGKNSYGIYLFHQPFFASGGGMVLYKVCGLPLFVAILITFCLCYVCPIFFMKLLQTKYLHVLQPFFLGNFERKKETGKTV